MARPAVIQDATILRAAREVFVSRGFRATTAEVAHQAGVSEGSIFKRFRSKFELFQAAMGSLDEPPEFVEKLGTRPGQADVRENLELICRELAAYLRHVVPLHLLSWSNPGPDGAPACMSGPNAAALTTLKAIAGYVEREMRLGRLARHDPEIVARTLVGAIHNFVIFELLFNSQEELPMSDDTFFRGVVELALRGLDPNPRSPESTGT